MRILCPLIFEAAEQVGEPVRYTLAHDLVVNGAKLLAEFGSGRPIQPVGLGRLRFASGFRRLRMRSEAHWLVGGHAIVVHLHVRVSARFAGFAAAKAGNIY
jgi:hypothetical protein